MNVKLGLIGHSISASRAPSLHRMLGDIYGYQVTYDLIEPEDNTLEAFEATLKKMRAEGYVACNVTFPFKQIATHFVDDADQAVKEVGSTNTLYLGEERISATNTDFSGFIHGYKSRMGATPAGDVLMLGAGGVGRAVAYGLTHVGAKRIYIYDISLSGAESLVESLQAKGADAIAITADEIPDIAKQVHGLVNCTPIGHQKTPGNPLLPSLFGGQKWAFDAVYIPLDTEFLTCAKAAGLQLVSGFDLFFFQGIDAFEFFTRSQIEPGDARSQFVDAFDVSSQLLELRA